MSSPVTYISKTYYTVTSMDPTEDTGGEVCAKAGMVCKGYTEPTTAVCRMFHPNAADTSSMSGDVAGVYCNGPPQTAVCSTKMDTCHACPACTNTVDCNTPIGNLYREMYVECVPASAGNPCRITVSARDVADFFNQIPSINAQLQGCIVQLPSGAGVFIRDGITVVDINMNSGNVQSFSVTVRNGRVTRVASGGGNCVQTLKIGENDFNSILTSTNRAQTVSYLVAQKRIRVTGCSFLSKARLTFVNPIARFFARRQAPSSPPPQPQPNCGQLGEQCNNRGCFSGICAAPEENINGQWRHVNYRCIDQADWNNYCQAHGNTPPAWSCITGPCS
ncbi:hypothetical protein KY362_05930 [Candidatus Woesearchaeota archaeon]|nr:hypothetical protein [Candidatus Woesearchaeota archaeon]